MQLIGLKRQKGENEMRRSDKWLRGQIKKERDKVQKVIDEEEAFRKKTAFHDFGGAGKRSFSEIEMQRFRDAIKIYDKVLGLLDEREKELRKKLRTAERKEKEAYQRTDAEWESIWHGYAEAIREVLALKRNR